jgi:serine/threonine-protein kinase
LVSKTGGSLPDVPPPHTFQRGERVAEKYRLLRRIGAGAMGTVWLAHNEFLDVDVAVKLMRIDNPRSDPDVLYQRLLQEARAAARLEHPAIVRVFDFGRTDDGTPFITMELLKGESLGDLLGREKRFEVTRAVQMVLPIADALATAHGRGIVHRDIKPENIFIAHDEYGRLQPKIVDFGVARFAEGGRTLTRSGALMGTPDYMAPEQARGEPDIDHRADLWALCVVLYEMMTGARPFGVEGANYLAVLRAIVHEPARPILDYQVGDPGLWLILERGLRKKPQERWDTMRVLGEALALWLYELGIREDAYGASLKTTWLQSGLDGVKILTPSTVPPPGDPRLEPVWSPAAQTLPEGSEVDRALPVTVRAPSGEPDSDATPDASDARADEPARSKSSLGPWLLAIATVAALIGGALWFRAEMLRTVSAEVERARVGPVPAKSAAVLPPTAPTDPVASAIQEAAQPAASAGTLAAASAPSAPPSASPPPSAVSRPPATSRPTRKKPRDSKNFDLGF